MYFWVEEMSSCPSHSAMMLMSWPAARMFMARVWRLCVISHKRHSRAMHLYQAGMPLALLTEWLGHADPETTLVYAHADTEMKRQALEKAGTATSQSPLPAPLWHDRDDIIQRLCGLKE